MKTLINNIIQLNSYYLKQNQKLSRILDCKHTPRISTSLDISLINPQRINQSKHRVVGGKKYGGKGGVKKSSRKSLKGNKSQKGGELMSQSIVEGGSSKYFYNRYQGITEKFGFGEREEEKGKERKSARQPMRKISMKNLSSPRILSKKEMQEKRVKTYNFASRVPRMTTTWLIQTNF